ncbi:hypothetical protein D9M71_338320 [compost metagenome]
MNVLVELAQGIVADVHGLVDLVRVGGQARLVAAAAEQVVIHHHADPPLVVVAFVTLHVVVRAHCRLGVKAWVEGRLGNFVLAFGRLHVGLGGFQVRVVFHHALLGFGQGGGDFTANRRRGFEFIGHAPHNGIEVRLGIGQIDFGGVEVVFRQCPASAGLVGIGVAAHAALGAQADLVVDPQVRLQVVLGQGHQFAALEDFEVNLGGAQGQILSRTLSVIGSRVDHAFGAFDFIGSVEPVEEHLPQAQFRLGVVENFGVVIAERPGIGVIAVPAPVGGVQINRWIKAPFGDLHVLIRRQSAVHPGCQFRVGRNGALDRFGQRYGLRLGRAGHGQKNRAADGG